MNYESVEAQARRVGENNEDRSDRAAQETVDGHGGAGGRERESGKRGAAGRSHRGDDQTLQPLPQEKGSGGHISGGGEMRTQSAESKPEAREGRTIEPISRTPDAGFRTITVAVAGNPNSGKSTLINAIAHLQSNGVWANKPVPLFVYPGSPEYTRRWGEPDDRAWERAHEDYLRTN